MSDICKECKYCTEQNSQSQRGKCIEEHSPRNAKGEPQKAVWLWSPGCMYYDVVKVEEVSKAVYVAHVRKQRRRR